ncbi:MAG: hypothetical protein P8M78_12630 [Myxococcota bacterium]|nr:hypothetical protein [Myxococcota bacterium]
MKGARAFFGSLVLLAFFGASLPALALNPAIVDQPTQGLEVERPFSWERAMPENYVLAARDSVDLESHGGYSTEYIFGMTKGVMRSTLVPALKPVVLLFTIPLDLAFLPFAAIGGFFR